MKIIKRTIFLLSVVNIISLSSCAIFNGGEKCDCPKFGENYKENYNGKEGSAENSEINISLNNVN